MHALRPLRLGAAIGRRIPTRSSSAQAARSPLRREVSFKGAWGSEFLFAASTGNGPSAEIPASARVPVDVRGSERVDQGNRLEPEPGSQVSAASCTRMAI